jgi:hypothetical protein
VKRKKPKKPTQEFKLTAAGVGQLDQQKVLDWLAEGDGHGIFQPSFYINELKFPKEYVEAQVATFKSNFSNPMETIFDKRDRPLKEYRGVRNLSFLRRFASDTKTPAGRSGTVFGRGTEARLHGHEIAQHLVKQYGWKVGAKA